jgi:hypothetical protein
MAYLHSPVQKLLFASFSMRRRIFAQFAVALFVFASHSSAQTLRPTQWPEQNITFLQARGQLWDLSPFLRPFEIEEVQAHLAIGHAHSQFLNDALNRWRLQPGEASIAVVSDNGLQNEPFSGAAPGDALSNEFAGWLCHGRQRLELAYRPRPWLQVFNCMALDNRLDESPRYIGIREGGFAGYTERAFVRLHHNGLKALIGREYLRIGPGIDASLLVSSHSRPLDQIALTFENRWLRYDFITASLDATSYQQEGVPAQQNRYLSLHHLQVRPLRSLYIGIGEAILYSSTGLELNYLNPVLAYHGEQMNGPTGGNTLGSIHVAAMPARGLTLYGDLLIDDIQIEKSGPGDLEPNEYGFMAGLRWADPFSLQGADFSSEYTRITNRTFNGQGGPWEKWLHRNEPIAHFLGNDFDRWLTGFSWWPRPAWRVACTIDLRRRGEGRIEKAFDSPWMDTLLGEEYHEPFPTGVVEKSGRYMMELSFQPRFAVLAYARAGYCTVTNQDNQSGVASKEFQGSIGVEFDFIHKLSID